LSAAHDLSKKLKEAQASNPHREASSSRDSELEAYAIASARRQEAESLRQELRILQQELELSKKYGVEHNERASMAMSRVKELEVFIAKQNANFADYGLGSNPGERMADMEKNLRERLRALDAATELYGEGNIDGEIAWKIKEGIWMAEKAALQKALTEAGGRIPNLSPERVLESHSHREMEAQRRSLVEEFEAKLARIEEEVEVRVRSEMNLEMNNEIKLCEDGFTAHIRTLAQELDEARQVEREKDNVIKGLENELCANVARAEKAKERMLSKAQRGLERALIKGAEEAEEVWDREKAYLKSRMKELTEDNERRASSWL